MLVEIAAHANGPKIVVEKSTVPVGTARNAEAFLRQHSKFEFTVVSMPEFLAEGTAIADLISPDRVVIGTTCDQAFMCLSGLYPEKVRVIRAHQPSSSELAKLLSNAMLAQRISSINSVTAFCEGSGGADVKQVLEIVGADSRIGSKYLQPSGGFGGACFEKDL